MSVNYLETGSTDPCYNLAFEEYVLKNRTEGDWLILWQNANTVVVGLNQNTAEEINPEFVTAHNVTVVRRETGGGAVYHDLGNLNYSFITDLGDAASLTIARFTLPVCRALEAMGVHAQTSGRNDITVDGQKVSGVAQRIYRNRILHHGTLLFDSDPVMRRIRDFESAAARLFAEGKIYGFAHLYLGEEAIAPAVCECLRDDDYITSTHRGHGHIIAKGGDINLMMAELFGRYTGYCKGKGGSMHIADRDKGILGANGIVGAGQPISCGAGLSIKIRKTDQVCVCFFGDGSTNQSTFHESLNLASIWKLPIVFVCENNHYGISMSQDRHQAIKDIADRGASYNIPGVAVDGNDPMGVAVALDNGLMVPNIVDADKKSLTQIHDEVKELAAAARGGTLPMEKLHGGTFTITNLGMYGIESFTPIINQPEVAILGVTTMEDKVVVRSGEMVIRPIMNLSLTADHRVVDGSVAAEFLQRVKTLLENPALILA